MKLFIYKYELGKLERMIDIGFYPDEYKPYLEAVKKAIAKITEGKTIVGKKDDGRVELRLTTRQAYCVFEMVKIYLDYDPLTWYESCKEIEARMVEAEALQPHAGLQLDGTYPSYKNKTPFA